MKVENTSDTKCFFCARTKGEARILVAGPGIFICPDCVEFASDIVDHYERADKHHSVKELWLVSAPPSGRFGFPRPRMTALPLGGCTPADRPGSSSRERVCSL